MPTPKPQGTPHSTVSAVCNAMHDLRYPGHLDLSTIFAVLAGVVRDNKALSPSVIKSVVEQMDELMDEIDNDKRTQTAEQLWREKETREAGYFVRPVGKKDQALAASIAGIRNQPLEVQA